MSTGMTIDQMIESAARAAGLPIRRIDDGWEVSFVDSYGEAYEPNIDNTQSFWLAAALRISVEHNHAEETRPWVCASIDGGPLMMTKAFVEDVPDESQRADRMRLAILHCAAAQAPAVGLETDENGSKTAGNGVDAGLRRGPGVARKESAGSPEFNAWTGAGCAGHHPSSAAA